MPHLDIPIMPVDDKLHPTIKMPSQIGFLIPFTEHDWYRSLTSQVKALAGQHGIGIQVIDAEQNVRDEVEFRRRQIAKKAAELVEPNDVVLVDSGPMAAYLAEELKLKKDITVMTIQWLFLIPSTPLRELPSSQPAAPYATVPR